jgi:uncharacterized protein (DUF433 family)
MTKTRYITSSEDVLGGELVIADTRIPVERIGELVKHGYTEENIRDEYPQLSEETVRGALYELVTYGRAKIAESIHESHTAHA